MVRALPFCCASTALPSDKTLPSPRGPPQVRYPFVALGVTTLLVYPQVPRHHTHPHTYTTQHTHTHHTPPPPPPPPPPPMSVWVCFDAHHRPPQSLIHLAGHATPGTHPPPHPPDHPKAARAATSSCLPTAATRRPRLVLSPLYAVPSPLCPPCARAPPVAPCLPAPRGRSAAVEGSRSRPRTDNALASSVMPQDVARLVGWDVPN